MFNYTGDHEAASRLYESLADKTYDNLTIDNVMAYSRLLTEAGWVRQDDARRYWKKNSTVKDICAAMRDVLRDTVLKRTVEGYGTSNNGRL